MIREIIKKALPYEVFQAEKKKIYFMIGFSLMITLFVLNMQFFVKSDPVEGRVLGKHTEKSLFMPPSYKLIIKGYDSKTRVSKEQFSEINVGDIIPGYKKSKNKFLAESSVFYEKRLGVQILIISYLIILLLIISFTNNSQVMDVSQKKYRQATKLIKEIGLGVLIVIFIFVTLFTGVNINLFHKINLWNQKETIGIVKEKEKEVISGRRRTSIFHDLWIEYTDRQNETILTKKGVSGATYKKYEVNDIIPIAYRKRNSYDLFIKMNDSKEILAIVFSFYVILYVSITILVLVRIVKWFRMIKAKRIINVFNESIDENY